MMEYVTSDPSNPIAFHSRSHLIVPSMFHASALFMLSETKTFLLGGHVICCFSYKCYVFLFSL